MKTTNQTLTEQTVELLRNRITSSGLSPGDTFATEAELAGEFKVSRSVLREAISRLRAVGLLESRQCVGLIVTRPDPVALFERAVQDGELDIIDLRQLGELRYTLEVGAVELAVRRADVGQLSRLAELAEEFAKTLTEKSPARSTDRVELDFHQSILQATGNVMLMRMHRVITTFFARNAEENEAWNAHGSDEQSAWEHRAIAQAFCERNVERARALLAGHLRGLLSTGLVSDHTKSEQGETS